MNKKALKINSWISIIFGITAVLLSTIYMCLSVSKPSDPDSWDDLAKMLIVFGTIITYILSSPLIISGIGTLNYLKGKNNYKFCIIFNIIGIILYSIFITNFIYSDVLGLFYYNAEHVALKITITLLISLTYVCPLIINTVILYREKDDFSVV